jgi:hypothetical protein
MPRELRISAVVTLPDGVFEEARAIVDARPILQQILEAFPDAAITFEIVTPKPRSAKPEGDAS